MGKNCKPTLPAEPSTPEWGFVQRTEERGPYAAALHPAHMTLVEISKFAKMGFVSKRKQEEVAMKYVESMSIKTPSVYQLVGNLSGGNQQKVVLAKWLMIAPKVLIVDEPTRGIDVGSKAEIYGLLNNLAQQGVAIIVVSSEIEEIMGICDRVITICEGKLTAEFPVEHLDRQKVLAAAIGKLDQ